MRKAAYLSIWVVIFMMPFDNMLFIDDSVSGGKIVGVVVAVLCILGLCEGKPLRLPSIPMMALVPYVVWCGLSLAWTLDSERTMITLQRMANLIFFLWAIWEFCRTKKELHGLLQGFLLGHIVPFAMIARDRNAAIGQLGDNEILRASGGGQDQNYLANLMVLGIMFSIYLFSVTPRSAWYRWLYAAFIVPAVLCTLLTGSRAGFVGMVLLQCWVAAYYALRPRDTGTLGAYFGRSMLYIAAFFAADLLALKVAPVVIPSTTLNRMVGSENYQVDELRNRLDIWTSGWKSFVVRPVQGLGLGAFYLADGPVDATVHKLVAHNIFVSIAVELGLVGLIFYLVFLTLTVRAVWRMQVRERLFWLGVLFIWMTFAFSGSTGVDKLTWFLAAMAMNCADAKGLFVSQESIVARRGRGMSGLPRLLPGAN